MFHDPHARIVNFSLHHEGFAKHYVNIAWNLEL
jgi:hypothetical protein